MNLDKEDFANITAVMIWAYEHDIDCEIIVVKDYGNVKYPNLRFHRGGKTIEVSLWGACVNKMESIWRDVGMKLCVQPPEFLTLTRTETE